MAERSAAQKAATRRMIAANKRARAGNGGRGRRSMRSNRRGAALGPRRWRGGRTHHLVPIAGGLVSLVGLLKAPVGGDSPIACAKRGDWSNFVNQLGQRTIPGRQGAAGGSAAMAAVYGGLGAAVLAGPIRRSGPGRGVNRVLSIKYAPKKRLALI